MNTSSADDPYDVIIIGGGVVGLAVLRAATLKGWRCALVERESDLLEWASGSNSGIVCTGVDAAPLERTLIQNSNVRQFCHEMNVPYRDCGSLVCTWPWEDGDLDAVLHESLGAQRLTREEVRQWEPHLSQQCTGAVHIPGEMVVDPWLFSIALAVHAKQNGATIFTQFEMDPDTSAQGEDGIWTIQRKQTDAASLNPTQLHARTVVNATGLWTDLVQLANGTCHWTAQPRRGQYRVYSSPTLVQRPIQPVPTDRTKGIFVFSTLYDQFVVGPTAVDQESREDRSVDPSVSAALEQLALRMVPQLDPLSYQGDYVGLRPGTEHRDYQISVSHNWIACASIRSTGK
jgi:glycerol-3-phosphate dehydrogenase